MVNSPLNELSTKVSIDSINICKLLFDIREYEIGNQLKKACTSIGANIREAKYAESKKDFIHKLHIALKECNESIYWLNIIKTSILYESKETLDLYNNCFSILRLLNASIKTAKKNSEK